MKTITVTDEQYDFLKNLSHELQTQDNLCTEFPLYVVYSRQEICLNDERTGLAENVHTIYINQFDSEDYCDSEEELEAKIKEEDGNRDDYEEITVGDINRFESAFLTRKGAEDYIKIQGHHMRKPFIYVEGLYRNYEMQEVRNILMGGCDEKR